MNRFIFVGERQSPKAAEIGATWQNKRMAARTLCAALVSLGIDPDAQQFINLWQEPGLRHPGVAPDAKVLDFLRHCSQNGVIVVGMGRIVQDELRKVGIPFRCMVHPAARGLIRRTDRYTAHVRAVVEATGEPR